MRCHCRTQACVSCEPIGTQLADDRGCSLLGEEGEDSARVPAFLMRCVNLNPRQRIWHEHTGFRNQLRLGSGKNREKCLQQSCLQLSWISCGTTRIMLHHWGYRMLSVKTRLNRTPRDILPSTSGLSVLFMNLQIFCQRKHEVPQAHKTHLKR